MKTTKILLGVLAAGAIGVGSASAATINIDTFNETQILSNTIAGSTIGDSTATGLAGVLGGQRDLVIVRMDANPGSIAATGNINNAFASQAALSNDAGANGIYIFQYDGAGQSNANEQNLGGFDLTDGGTNTRIELGLEFIDLAGTQFRFVAHSGAGNASTSSQVLGPVLAQQTVNFDFASFTTALGTGADFANLTAFQLVVDSPSQQPFDARFNIIRATSGGSTTTTTTSGVPEPSMIALIGVGLLGLGLARRRRA